MLLSALARAESCTPCKAIWPMQDLVAKSDLVAVVRRGDGEIGNTYEQGPELVELEILDILKGNGEVEVGDYIDAQSWYGICPYGVQMERYETAVVFLNKVSGGIWLFSSPTYESATYTHALCNDEAMTLKGKNLLIWDPAIRKQVNYPLTEFKRVFIHTPQPVK